MRIGPGGAGSSSSLRVAGVIEPHRPAAVSRPGAALRGSPTARVPADARSARAEANARSPPTAFSSRTTVLRTGPRSRFSSLNCSSVGRASSPSRQARARAPAGRSHGPRARSRAPRRAGTTSIGASAAAASPSSPHRRDRLDREPADARHVVVHVVLRQAELVEIAADGLGWECRRPAATQPSRPNSRFESLRPFSPRIRPM